METPIEFEKLKLSLTQIKLSLGNSNWVFPGLQKLKLSFWDSNWVGIKSNWVSETQIEPQTQIQPKLKLKIKLRIKLKSNWDVPPCGKRFHVGNSDRSRHVRLAPERATWKRFKIMATWKRWQCRENVSTSAGSFHRWNVLHKRRRRGNGSRFKNRSR